MYTQIKTKALFAMFLFATLPSVIFNTSAYAEELPSFTDNNGVTWAYNTEDSIIRIGFKSAPTDATTITVPSLSEVIAKIGDNTLSTANTYYIENLLDDASEATVPTTLSKLDMTNAAKVQIKSFSPLLSNRTNEIELVFGNDIVIADNSEIVGYTTIRHEGAFEGLKLKVTGLDKIKYFGWRAFKDATFNGSNTNVTINQNQTLGGQVFEGTNLKSLTLDTQLIGEAICRSCMELTNVSFGDNAKWLFGNVFEDTPALKQDMTFNKVEHIGAKAFRNSAIKSVEFNESMHDIDYRAFEGTNLGSLDFGESNAIIGFAAFNNAGLNSLNFGKVYRIESAAFANNNLTTLDFPKTITALYGVGIFMNNPLTAVTIRYDTTQAKLNSIYGGATPFRVSIGCVDNPMEDFKREACTTDPARTIKTLKLVAPYEENETPAEQAGINNSIISQFAPGAKNIVRREYFVGMTGLESVEIGEGYEYIGEEAFWGGSNFGMAFRDSRYMNGQQIPGADGPSVLSLPSTLKVIDERAFQYLLNDSDLVLDNLPENITFIGDRAFQSSTGFMIRHLNLPNIKVIAESAFYGVKIEKITINESIEHLGDRAFAYNRALKNIIIDADIYGRNSNGQTRIGGHFWGIFCGWLQGDYGDGYVPDGFDKTNSFSYGKQEYHLDNVTFTDKAVTNYPSQFEFTYIDTDVLDMSESGFTNIVYDSFNAARIGEFRLPHGLKTIEKAAFYNANISEPLVLPDGLETIEENAMMRYWVASDDDRIIRINAIPNTVKKIGTAAFYGAVGLTADFDSTTIEYIGNSAFSGTNIHSIALHDNIQYLGQGIVFKTKGLKDITIDMDLYSESAMNRGINGYNTFDNFNDTSKFSKIIFTEKATKPIVPPTDYCTDGVHKCTGLFFGIEADEIDLSRTNWTNIDPVMFQESKVGELKLPGGLEQIDGDAFYMAEISETLSLPESLKLIDQEGFQWAKLTVDSLPEGLKRINRSGFYGADITDNLVIPGGIEFLGDSSFNAGDVDVHYDAITLKPDLSYEKTDNQPVFVLFWGADVNKMVVESANLPALEANDGIPEFHGMPMQEVEITKLPAISANAFEDCVKLEKVDASKDSTLRDIRKEAFVNDEKLKVFEFSPSLKDQTVTVGQRAFKGTAFETMGTSADDFDLTAAKFDASAEYSFSGMPKLRSVRVPRSFSYATIPAATFYNDTALEEATIDYKITLMGNGAFANDNKLKRIFIWGNTVILDENLPGYEAPTAGMGADGDDEITTPTIPEGTDIYAYTTSPTEKYAGSSSRESFDGTFYPLDEVVALTSNDSELLLNEAEDDFDKSGLTLYALRRDGIILQSDEWLQFDGAAYARADSDVDFDNLAEEIYDTPVPFNELSFSNENFIANTFAIADNKKTATIFYTDKYTTNKVDTTVRLRKAGETPILPGLPFTTPGEIFEYLLMFAICTTVVVLCARPLIRKIGR